MNPDILAMLEECLARSFEVLVLTNAGDTPDAFDLTARSNWKRPRAAWKSC